MFVMSGNHGYLYAGYRLVLAFERWQLTRKHEVLGRPTARGYGTVTFRSPTWMGDGLTKLDLKLGNSFWAWTTFSIGFEGDKVTFQPQGDPEIR